MMSQEELCDSQNHHTERKQGVILSCTLSNHRLVSVKLCSETHRNMGMELSDPVKNEIQQIIDIGMKVRCIDFEHSHDVEAIALNAEKVCVDKFNGKIKHLQNLLNDKKNENDLMIEHVEQWKNKYDLLQKNIQVECKNLAIEQANRIEETTATMQNRLHSTIEDMKTKMIQYHSKSASTKSVGNSGENCVMEYITTHYPKWIVRDTHGEARKGDFHTFLGDTDSSPWILNEVKAHKGSIRTEQVRKFYRDIDDNRPAFAIMYSMFSNIVGKTHGQYELRGSTHVIFLANVSASMNCIQFAHSICTTLLHTHARFHSDDASAEETTASIDDSRDELIHKQNSQLRDLQRTTEQSVHSMREQTKYLISMYEKNIQHDKKKIEELRKSIVAWKEFEQERYMNKDDATSAFFPWYCSACDFKCKKVSQLYRHICTLSHCKNLSL